MEYGIRILNIFVATEMENESKCSGVLITLGDQVKLNEQDYQKLVDVYDGEKIVVSSYGRKKGPPAIFPRKYFEQLIHLKGDIGAREVIEKIVILLFLAS